MSHFINVNSISDTKSVAEFEAKSNDGDVNKTNLFLLLLVIEDEVQKKQQLVKKRTLKNDVAKRIALPSDNFDCIHLAPC